MRASAISRDARLSSDKGLSESYFDLSTVHSMVLPALTKPLPLQAFWPLQALAADLHALWPLQELTPVHGTWADAAVAKVPTANTAAAVANMVRLVMDFFLPVEPPLCGATELCTAMWNRTICEWVRVGVCWAPALTAWRTTWT